ncbi:MAG: FtsX-like permease family protein [Acholeplasmataceae bacterium]|jgi:lipoprotein-releasing system permease protein|nr:FtsX-like permease family protein [Acholeplasmataceae bacterium]
MKLALQIAWRFLSSAKRQTFIIVLGIAVGVSVQVFIGSLISGLQKSLVDTTIGSSSHITILKDDFQLIEDYEILMDDLNQNNKLSVVVPTVTLPEGILTEGLVTKEILLRGFDLQEANQIYKFDDKLTDGTDLPINDYEIILGIGLKDALGIDIGDEIAYELRGVGQTFTVVNFFDFNVDVINQTWAVTTLQTAQIVLDSDAVTSIETQIKDVFAARSIASSFIDTYGDEDYNVTNWMDLNEELLSGLNGQSTSSYMIQVFVIISVVLGISSVLAITVLQKSKQIGILKAMGITDKDASLVFLFEGFILGIFGAIGGVLLGLGLLYSFQTFALNPDGTPVVPIFIEPNFIMFSALIALGASTLAALIPAIKSSKLTVIEVIRNA